MELKVVLVAIIFVLETQSSGGLNISDPGVCLEEIQTPKYVNQRYTVRCGKRTCTKSRRIKIIQKETKPLCCNDWQYDDETKSCKPQCQLGCEGGRCVAPGVCACEPPLVLDTETNSICKPAICNPACYNANCTGTNTCTCLANHSVLNATHCAPTCSPGYHNNPTTLLCEPRCEKPCKNGICTAPDVCSCNAGYELNIVDKYSCMPSCEPFCQNATCISPNECSCLAGYEKIDNFSCQPTCESCENGQCISPGKCVCNKGYVKSDETSVCVPKCESCAHGDCIGPNNCSCHNGYFMSGGECKPICNENCTNGYCSAPNICTCNRNYEPDPINKYLCIPICEPKCVNATCSDPGVCSCKYGYEPKDSRVCAPVCELCNHGDCISPGVCACHDGYNTTDDGCSPVCQDTCYYGYCTAPNVCSCMSGYFKKENDTNMCYKPCAGACEMGYCATYGECLCYDGYRLQNASCVKIEIANCSSCNGSCVKEICECSDHSPCHHDAVTTGEVAEVHSPRLAGLEMTWVIGGVVMLLLFTLVISVIDRLRRRRTKEKAPDDQKFGSIMHTIPDTLIRCNEVYIGNSALGEDDVEQMEGKMNAQESGVHLLKQTLADEA